MGNAVHKIVTEMTEVARPGQTELAPGTRDQLGRLTALLLEADRSAIEEYQRYLGVTRRALPVESLRDQLAAAYAGARILVTGGTGCIGSMLIRQLLQYGPHEITCFYALSNDFEPIPGVAYRNVDVQDEAATRRAIRSISPDVVFHCAAQRSPWLAERAVSRTVRTNVLGTRNVLRGARDADVGNFVHASTGKAMRYHTSDVYAGTKKIAEWLVQEYAAEGRRAGAARFTHVVDNAVLLEKLSAARHRGGVMRVHGADIGFYVESALESAQLLLIAGAQASPRLPLVAIRDLGEPAQLLRVVLGGLQADSHGDHPALYLSGYEKGYESGNPPGLYDPSTATDVSPLINAMEASTATPMPGVPEVDRFRSPLPTDRCVELLADRLAVRCRCGDRSAIAAELSDAVRQQAEAAFSLCPEELFVRIDRMARAAGTELPTTRRPRDAQRYRPEARVA